MNNKIHEGNLTISEDAEIDFDTIAGYLIIKPGAKLTAGALTSVGGYLAVSGSAKLDASALTSVGGNLAVSGSAKLDKELKHNKKSWAMDFSTRLKFEIKIKVRNDFRKNGFIFADEILAKIVSEKTIGSNTVYETIMRGKTAYCVQSGEKFSHGDTVEKAIEDLRYKIADRDQSGFKEWALEKEISIDEAIESYRVITGACELGVREFCESINIPESLTVAKVIEITEGRYGHEQYREFFR
jgi:hypothetical protein